MSTPNNIKPTGTLFNPTVDIHGKFFGGCRWCRIGVPLNEFGNHIIKGYYGSGDAAIKCLDTTRSALNTAKT